MPSPDLLLDLTRRYLEPHRHYHDIRHVADLLSKGRDLDLTEEQVMAIWFHDAIWRPGSLTNEAESAALAREVLLAEGWSGDRIHVVERTVLDTFAHEPSIPEAALVLDLDMSSLGGPWEAYWDKCQLVWAESPNVRTPPWAAGRSRWIESTLAKPRIFSTPWGAPLERSARRNMQRELGLLREYAAAPASD